MATLQDHSNFKIVVKPEYSNWWSFYFEFYYKDQPVFNPEVMMGRRFKADEYESWPFLPVLAQAVESKTDGETFGWQAWEEEVKVEIKSVMKSLDRGEDGIFHFTVFVSETVFKEGEMNYGFHNAGIKLCLDREEFKKFYEELRVEMSEIAKKKIEELAPKGKGYEGHIKFLEPYVI